MSTFIKLATLEYPRHEGDIRLEHPDIAAGKTGEEFPCPSEYAPVNWVSIPAHDRVLQRVREGAPECVDGVWQRTWVVYDAPPDEIADDPMQGLLDHPGSAPDVVD